MSDTQGTDIVEHASRLPFGSALDRLVRAITEHGMTIFASIDHAANARDIGMGMPPATVLIYGNPKGGTPIMLATPPAAPDLPLRVLVREREDGKFVIAFHPVAEMLRRAGVPDDAAIRLQPTQRMLIEAVAA